jgi:hypothetical protein
MVSRKRTWLRVCFWTFGVLGTLSASRSVSAAQNSEGSPYKKLRSISGAAGHEDHGHFIMDDARSMFTAGKDSKVIVYFEWEGPIGPHHFEGLWKSSEGKIVLISDFRYEATTTHYSGYWTMLMSEGTPSGEWSIEARIDGEFAGTHSFVITGSPVAPGPSVPQPLSTSDLYKRALSATSRVEKVGDDGTMLGHSVGFWISDNALLTSFGSIDGAASIRVQFPDGRTQTTDQVLAWNRWQDWALLQLAGPAPSKLKPGPNQPLNVGDQCVFLIWGPAGPKVTDGSITGKNSFQKAGDRLIVASGATPESFGGPLLNMYGDYVGMVGGAIAPGGDPMRILALLNEGPNSPYMIQPSEPNALAVPLRMLPGVEASPRPTALKDLAAKGEFLPAVLQNRSVGFVTLTSYLGKLSSDVPMVRDYRQVFTHRDGKASVYVNWMPVAKAKTTCAIRIYNLDNVMLTGAKPKEISLSPGRTMITTWEIPVAILSPSIYRVDLLLGSQVVWREYFKVME